jgi:hypothetical protein
MRGTLSKILTMVCIAALALLVLPAPFGFLAATVGVTGVFLVDASVLCMTASRNLSQSLKATNTFSPAVVTANAAKTIGVDTRDFESVMLVAQAGAIAGAGIVTPVAQECDTIGGVYTDVAAADLEGAFVAFTADSVQKVGYKGTKQFVAIRMAYTSGTSVACGGTVVMGDAHQRPVA